MFKLSSVGSKELGLLSRGAQSKYVSERLLDLKRRPPRKLLQQLKSALLSYSYAHKATLQIK